MFAVNFTATSFDKRILCGHVLVAITFLGSFFVIMTSGLRLVDEVILALMICILTLLHFIGFWFLRENKTASLLFLLFATYIWVAYPVQLLLTLHNPQSAVFLLTFIRPEIIQSEISGAFQTVFPGIIALFIGILIGRNNFPRNASSTNFVLRHNFFIITILSLMLLKIFVQTSMDIGLPGVRPKGLPIPFLVGFLDMLTRPGLFAIVNLYFYTVLRFKEEKGLLIALSLMLINALLAVRVGWKSELALQGFLMAFYLIGLYDSMSKARRRLIAMLTLVSMVSMFVLYPLINVYRHKLLNEQDFSKALARTEDAIQKKDNNSTLHSIIDRINGIRGYYLAIKLASSQNFPLESLLNQDVPDLIKERLYGRHKDKAITAFGTTQLSVFYLIGGVPFLMLGCLIIGAAIKWTGNFISNRVFLSSVTFDAYLPFFSILWVKVLASGGGIPILMKEFALVILCLFVMERLCYKANERNDKFFDAPINGETKYEREGLAK